MSKVLFSSARQRIVVRGDTRGTTMNKPEDETNPARKDMWRPNDGKTPVSEARRAAWRKRWGHPEEYRTLREEVESGVLSEDTFKQMQAYRRADSRDRVAMWVVIIAVAVYIIGDVIVGWPWTGGEHCSGAHLADHSLGGDYFDALLACEADRFDYDGGRDGS